MPTKLAKQRLNSWKEIASYLGREIRTVQRWEKREGLPVHRLNHEKGSSVYAIPSELDEWWQQRKCEPAEEAIPPAAHSRTAWIAGACIVLVLAAAVASYLLLRTPGAASARLHPLPVGRVFAGWTGDGRGPHFIRLDWPAVYLAISPDESELYAATAGDPVEIAIIDAARETVKQTIPLPDQVRSLAVAGGTLYAALADGTLLAMDARSKSTRLIHLGRSLGDIAITPDRQSLYAALEFEGIRRLDLKTGQIAALPATACPEHLAFTPDGKKLVVNYQCGGPQGRRGHDSLEIFDLATWRAVRTVTGLPSVGGVVAVSPDGKQIWASGQDACSRPDYDHAGCPAVPAPVLHVLRSSDGNVLRSLPLRGALAFLPDSSRAIVAGIEETLVIDTTDFIAEEELPVRIFAIAFAPSRKRAFAALVESNAIAAFDLSGSAGPELLGLAAHWPGDGNVSDVAAGNAGTLHNGAKFGKGRIGAAFQFDGNGAYAELPYPSHAAAPNGDATADLWLKLDGAPHAASVAEELEMYNRSRVIWGLRLTGDGRLVFCGAGPRGSSSAAGGVTGTTRLQPGAWYHVALVRQGATGTLWLNARKEASGRVNFDRTSNDGPLLLGEAGPGALRGLIDEVELYTRPLSGKEIARLYRAGLRGECLR